MRRPIHARDGEIGHVAEILLAVDELRLANPDRGIEADVVLDEPVARSSPWRALANPAAADLRNLSELREHRRAVRFKFMQARAFIQPSAECPDFDIVGSRPAFRMDQLRIEFLGMAPRIRRAGKSAKHFAGNQQGFTGRDG